MERVQVPERGRKETLAVAEGRTASFSGVGRRQRARGSVVVVTDVAVIAAAHHDGVVALAKEGQIRAHDFGGWQCGRCVEFGADTRVVRVRCNKVGPLWHRRKE